MLLPDLSVRCRVAERMDDPELEEAAHREALADLSRINRLSRVAEGLMDSVRAAREGAAGRPVQVLDVACGSGDVAVRLAGIARQAGIGLRIDLCDVSELAVSMARERAAQRGVLARREAGEVGEGIGRVFTCDAMRDPLPGGYDLVMVNLFLHHLDEDAATTLVRHMAAAGERVVASELVRSRLGYLLAWAGTRVISRSSVVRYDGPASVRGAYTGPELAALFEAGGLVDVRVARVWPGRMIVSGRRGG